MIKTLIKLALIVLLANAIWRAGSAYTSYYRFKDAVAELAMYGKAKPDDELRAKVIELATQYDEPVDPDAVMIRRDPSHLYIDCSYTKPVSIVPGYEYQWPFAVNVSAVILN
jgi:hypothetical protein